MKYILCCTDRPGARSRTISYLIQNIYKELGHEFEVLDLAEMNLDQIKAGSYATDDLPKVAREAVEKITASDGLVVVVPEYNGSFPGIVKTFIDRWKYPESFENRPVCYVGLGGLFGGLRPVEHLQQVFGYRNAFNYPQRVFLQQIPKILTEDGKLEAKFHDLLVDQAKGFVQFIEALRPVRTGKEMNLS